MNRTIKYLLALLLMDGGSMMAQNKLDPMVSAYVQQAKTRRAAAAEEQKPGLFMVNVQAHADPDEVSTQITEKGAEVKAAMGADGGCQSRAVDSYCPTGGGGEYCDRYETPAETR